MHFTQQFLELQGTYQHSSRFKLARASLEANDGRPAIGQFCRRVAPLETSTYE